MHKISYGIGLLLILLFTNGVTGQTRVYKYPNSEEKTILDKAKASHKKFEFLEEYNYYVDLQPYVRNDVFNTNVVFLKRKMRKAKHNAEIQCYLKDSYAIGFTYQYCGDWIGTQANYMLSAQFFPLKYNRSVNFMAEFYSNFRMESGTVDAVNSDNFQYQQQTDFQWEHVGGSGGINILAVYPLYVYTMAGLGYGAKYTAYKEYENTGTVSVPDFTFRRDVFKTDIETIILSIEGGIIVSSPHIGFTVGYKHFFDPVEGTVLGGGPKFGIIAVLPFKKWFGESYCGGLVDLPK